MKKIIFSAVAFAAITLTSSAHAQAPVSDPQTFLNWVNSYRASAGLRAVGYDQNLANWAYQNSCQQASRGIGHFVMGTARRQNSGMGALSTVCHMWTTSPAHRAALLDPTISFVGIAGAGMYWTYNAY
jgi:uncharacterized protein YkwD